MPGGFLHQELVKSKDSFKVFFFYVRYIFLLPEKSIKHISEKGEGNMKNEDGACRSMGFCSTQPLWMWWS